MSVLARAQRNEAMFLDMLTRQNQVNLKAGGPDWVQQTIDGKMDHATAAIEEMIEYRKSEPYEWWKPALRDEVNMRVELVDAFHFFMSLSIAKFSKEHGNAETAIQYLAPKLAEHWDKKHLFNGGISAWRSVVSAASSVVWEGPNFMAGPFFKLCEENQINTVKRLHRLYTGKAVLNLFRKAHGYKEGTYKKVWCIGGQVSEDNIFLMQYSMRTPEMVMLGAEEIQTWLEETYKTQV